MAAVLQLAFIHLAVQMTHKAFSAVNWSSKGAVAFGLCAFSLDENDL